MCKDTSRANDILQNTFLNVVKNFSSFKNKSSIKTWLFSIAKNECYQFFRKNKNMKFLYDVENIVANISVEDIVIRNDEVGRILKAIDSLGKSKFFQSKKKDI